MLPLIYHKLGYAQAEPVMTAKIVPVIIFSATFSPSLTRQVVQMGTELILSRPELHFVGVYSGEMGSGRTLCIQRDNSETTANPINVCNVRPEPISVYRPEILNLRVSCSGVWLTQIT